MFIGIFMGILSAVALLIIMTRLGLRKFVGYPVIVDITGSALFAVLFAGTLTGMMVAVIAALTLSGMIWVVRFLMGFERFNFKTRHWEYSKPRYMKNKASTVWA
jgi:hypothetical protein